MQNQNDDILNIYKEDVNFILNSENFINQSNAQIVLDYNVRKKYLEYLKFYSNNLKKMQKVVKYSKMLNFFMEEYYLISLIEIDNDYIESNMINHFKNNEIKNTHDFISFYNKYKELYEKNIKTKTMTSTII